jgi:hypothetical protein
MNTTNIHSSETRPLVHCQQSKRHKIKRTLRSRILTSFKYGVCIVVLALLCSMLMTKLKSTNTTQWVHRKALVTQITSNVDTLYWIENIQCEYMTNSMTKMCDTMLENKDIGLCIYDKPYCCATLDDKCLFWMNRTMGHITSNTSNVTNYAITMVYKYPNASDVQSNNWFHLSPASGSRDNKYESGSQIAFKYFKNSSMPLNYNVNDNIDVWCSTTNEYDCSHMDQNRMLPISMFKNLVNRYNF